MIHKWIVIINAPDGPYVSEFISTMKSATKWLQDAIQRIHPDAWVQVKPAGKEGVEEPS